MSLYRVAYWIMGAALVVGALGSLGVVFVDRSSAFKVCVQLVLMTGGLLSVVAGAVYLAGLYQDSEWK